ncbi:rhomboid family intramembrane serine protease [Lacticaseibacillus pabuli]|uniref:Rhomboid family intramembrane serine protease n=1 Tax=Lacticaseibacillus pabuli TaxID=3025672 RepID=A0ABY7WWS2_9LACO|nr:rhomboid family intramembrane serine protease [Lacticaseibacillus sp. KACC 23028]WDF83585.1 rhomboid family intramembrane serine protease [Lacticaseibacillus sp. KACC 23028]
MRNLRDQPIVTYALLVICVLVFLGEQLAGGSQTSAVLVGFGARFAPLVYDGEWWRLFTAMFLHIGWMHLLMNMFTLYILGRLSEGIFGHWRFLVIYLISGLGGNFAGLLFDNQNVLAAGASTALFGLLGAFLMIGDSFRDNPAIKAMTRQFLVLIGINLLFDITQSGIDIAGHLGGLIAGFLIAGVVGAPRVGQISRTRRILMGVVLVAAPLLLAVTVGGGFE